MNVEGPLKMTARDKRGGRREKGYPVNGIQGGQLRIHKSHRAMAKNPFYIQHRLSIQVQEKLLDLEGWIAIFKAQDGFLPQSHVYGGSRALGDG